MDVEEEEPQDCALKPQVGEGGGMSRGGQERARWGCRETTLPPPGGLPQQPGSKEPLPQFPAFLDHTPWSFSFARMSTSVVLSYCFFPACLP